MSDNPRQPPVDLLQHISNRLDSVSDRVATMAESKAKDRWWEIAVKIAIPLIIGAFGMTIQHEVRLGRIEESRFTNKDGAALEARVMASVPPQWLKDMVNEIRSNQQSILTRLRELELTSKK